MRNLEVPGRSVAVGNRGMVATSNPQAALAAFDILRSGGNTIDAAVAVGPCFLSWRPPRQASAETAL